MKPKSVPGERLSSEPEVLRSWRKNRREWLTFLAFTAPNLLLFIVFTYLPLFYNAGLSLLAWDMLSPRPVFIGLGNYVRLFSDADFWRVLGNTFVYAISVVLIAQGLAFVLAMLLNRRSAGMGFFRSLAFLPQMTMTVAAALVWTLLLDPRAGPLSLLYNFLGVQGPRWLASSALALWAIILLGIWRETGFSAFFFLAGLQGLDRDVLDSARVDGASSLDLLTRITLPLMTPIAYMLMVSGFIQAVKVFDAVAIMTEGGPVYPASATYVYHLYKLAFRDFQAGYAAALAAVFFLLTVGFSFIQIRLSRRWVHYE